ncbi:hypothetical protein TURU_128147 [Turdus rufiventris]|nr:hypothetical protein TURU_128147 [Turdus rufiventris]
MAAGWGRGLSQQPRRRSWGRSLTAKKTVCPIERDGNSTTALWWCQCLTSNAEIGSIDAILAIKQLQSEKRGSHKGSGHTPRHRLIPAEESHWQIRVSSPHEEAKLFHSRITGSVRLEKTSEIIEFNLRPQHHYVNYTTVLSPLNASRDGDSITCLGRRFQCLTTSEKIPPAEPPLTQFEAVSSHPVSCSLGG